MFVGGVNFYFLQLNTAVDALSPIWLFLFIKDTVSLKATVFFVLLHRLMKFVCGNMFFRNLKYTLPCGSEKTAFLPINKYTIYFPRKHKSGKQGQVTLACLILIVVFGSVELGDSVVKVWGQKEERGRSADDLVKTDTFEY